MLASVHKLDGDKVNDVRLGVVRWGPHAHSIPQPPDYFDRSKPFYPLVVNFIAAIHGWNYLFGRGVGRMIVSCNDDPAAVDATVAAVAGKAKISTASQLRALASLPAGIGVLELGSRTQKDPMFVDSDAIADELINERPILVPEMVRASEQLLVLAWEMTRELHTHDPLWEFLRHCRNAGAHGGRFHFYRDEPRRPAKFAHLEITRSLQGTPVFGRVDGDALMLIGDALHLLWQIEQTM